MNVSVGARWEEFVEKVIGEGRYASASAVVREGLRLVEEREEKLAALRARLDAAIENGGSHSSEEMMAAVEKRLEQSERNTAPDASAVLHERRHRQHGEHF